MILIAIISLVAAALAAALFTAVMIRIAPRVGLIDRPDQRRKLHSDSMPLGGGLPCSSRRSQCSADWCLFLVLGDCN